MPAKSPASATGLPTVKVSRRGASRLKDGHVWVYRSDLVSADGVPPGALVNVADERGKFLGTALYSSSSQIAIPIISPAAVGDLPGLLRARIETASGYRYRGVQDTVAYRTVCSDADRLRR